MKNGTEAENGEKYMTGAMKKRAQQRANTSVRERNAKVNKPNEN